MFVLARESKGGLSSLPGTPMALVRSKNSNLNALFLCALTQEQVRTDKGLGANKPEKKADEKKKDDDEDEPDPKAGNHRPFSGAPKRVTWDPSTAHANGPPRYRGGSMLPPSAVPCTMAAYAAAVHESLYGGALRLGPLHGGAIHKPFEPERKRQRPDMSVEDALRAAPLADMEADEYDRTHAEMSEATKLAGGSASSSSSRFATRTAIGTGAQDKAARFSKLVYSLRLPADSEFQLLPRLGEEDRFTAYIGGKSGSGKSHATASLAEMYQKNFPDRTIYFVCATKGSDDPAYDKVKMRQIDVSKFIGLGKSDGGFDVKAKFGDSGCLIIFDDIDAFPSAVYNDLNTAITAIYNIGRKLKVSIIVTSHMLSNYNKTRGAIHESQFVILFPHHDFKQAVGYLCDKLGVPPEVSKNFRNKQGRWVCIHAHEPHCIISQTEAEMF